MTDPVSLPTVSDEQAEALARAFHEAYERLAPSFGYQTRKASAVPWADVPEANKRLMIAVAAAVRPLVEAEARADERRKIAEALRAAAVHEPNVDVSSGYSRAAALAEEIPW